MKIIFKASILLVSISLIFCNISANQCPKYKCSGSSQTTCAASDTADNSIVYINEKTCVIGTQYCAFSTASLYTGGSVTGSCTGNTEAVATVAAKAYPGEACTVDGDCLYGQTLNVGKCVNKVCEGYGEGVVSGSTVQCNAGLYRDPTTGKCVKQLAKGTACTLSEQCQNAYVCYNNSCIEYFSLTGTNYSTSKANDLWASAGYVCENQEANNAGTSCAKTDYTSDLVAKANTDGYVTCNLGTTCTYNNGFDNTNQACVCGFNEDGQGYCPLPSARRKFIF